MSASALDRTAAARGRMDARQTLGRPVLRSAASLLKSRTQGPVRFPPFEDVGAHIMQEIVAYQISSFGQIQQCSEHIPYNSTKKNFYEKTGRESIEAFKYEFRVPGQQATYKVMWDYNIGLVRMTPFFKCLGYPKMLEKNPGLREISPSITGGSVSAQGYWMPYRCARAVCATFCHDIAGALIPLFGPEFPLECTPPDSQFFGDMVISHQLVVEATMEAEASRHAYESRKEAALNGSMYQPTYRTQVPNSPNRAVIGPGTATEPWVIKRRRPDQECSNDAYAPTRAKAARVGFDATVRQKHENDDHGRKGKMARSAREEYAAAAVLVELQTTGLGAAADPLVGGHATHLRHARTENAS
ncbi:hypothetical protein HRG_003648 [Hirsutella rhossiliensis]|uniref:HTH APSES-type domain-containing protein n=1 Tax=Hirsutella rhossiliensis TaxID=111463 RepID=A0A9P8N2X2_9HYPO|nr:uncharacterized protein HRG_03648 [Hirsutella rhossiliensis]KAH0965632.1 hypothetical protein HRG_03648 [Hirsutella rhossiliensis]